ncbi:hypothetical protein VPH35_066114 [Triticum aestivum]
MARRPRFCCFVAHNCQPPASISLLKPTLATTAPCRSCHWTRLSSAAARRSSSATPPRPCPAFHRLAGDLLHTGSSLDDPSPTSLFDSSSDLEVLVVPLPCCVLHQSSPTDAFQHKPHRATAKTCLIDEGPAQAGKTDYMKLPSTFMHGCIKTASDIAKYTTGKTT